VRGVPPHNAEAARSLAALRGAAAPTAYPPIGRDCNRSRAANCPEISWRWQEHAAPANLCGVAAPIFVCRLRRSARLHANENCDREVPRVDVAMKLNVLAACAALVFVSAILLGAF
jgi:hypothetical protein